MIFSTTRTDPDTVYAVDLPETLRDAAVRAQSPGYRFWSYPGRVARNARKPSAAQDLDTVVGPLTMAVDGTLSAMTADGTMKPFAIPSGPAGKDGSNGKDGKDGSSGKDGAAGPSILHFAGFVLTVAGGAYALTWSKPFAVGVEPVCTVSPAVSDGFVYRIRWTATAVGIAGTAERALLSTGVLGAYAAVPAGVRLSVIAYEPYP